MGRSPAAHGPPRAGPVRQGHRPAEGRGAREGRRAHRRGPPAPPAHALRGPAELRARGRPAPRHARFRLRRDRGGRAAAGAAPDDLRGAPRRRQRAAQGGVLQPAVPEGDARPREESRLLRPRRARRHGLAPPRDALAAVRDRRGGRARRDPHRPPRPGLREARPAHGQAAAARPRAPRGAGARGPRGPPARGPPRAALARRPRRGPAARAPARRGRRPRPPQPLPLAGPPAPHPRGAAPLPARPRPAPQRPARREEARGLRGPGRRARGGEADPALPADRGAEARAARDRGRPALAPPHEPARPGRRGLRQDARGAPRDGRRPRERLPGGLHGPHRDPGRAALPHAAPPAEAVPLPGRAPDLRGQGQGARGDAGPRSPRARRRS